MFRIIIIAAAASLLCAAGAMADPCEAVSMDAPAPAALREGATFSGSVVLVIDGDSLCVATGTAPSAWVEVRLADFNAAESRSADGPAAKAALQRIAFGEEAVCVAGNKTYDRIAAICRIRGESIGDLMRAADVAEAGNGAARARAPGFGRATLDPRAAPGRATQSVRAPVRADERAGGGRGASAGGFIFRSCAAARAAGAAPMKRGSPGYNPRLDGDGDGVACEPFRRR